MPQQNSAVVLVVDRLSAGFLGPYGNTWLDTPNFNQLASESLVCESVLADGPTLDGALRSFWQGGHALWPPAAGNASLAAAAADRKLKTILVTDEPAVAEHSLAGSFAHTELVRLPAPTAPAETAEETLVARLFAAALDVLERQREPFLLWLHARAMAGPWDAPLDLRRRFADDEDPDPLALVEAPARALPPDHDPDELFSATLAYAGQVSVVDMALGALLDTVTALPRAAETLLAVTSPRGFPLGAHGRMGAYEEALYGELVQTPLFVRFPQLARSQRTHALVQPADLAATLAAWLGVEMKPPAGRDLAPLAGDVDVAWRDRLVSALGGERSIRTPGWYLRQPAAGDAVEPPPVELFVKPDDYWEVNDVANRCPAIVEQLQGVLAECEKNPGEVLSASAAPLPAELLVGPD